MLRDTEHCLTVQVHSMYIDNVVYTVLFLNSIIMQLIFVWFVNTHCTSRAKAVLVYALGLASSEVMLLYVAS